MNIIIEELKQQFKSLYNNQPILVKAPGRINLIGEHTDYNEGFVLPAAVDHAIYFAVAQNHSSYCKITSIDFNETFEFKIEELGTVKHDSWKSYIYGVVAELMALGKEVAGFDMAFTGQVPQGAGMSSSAALECGATFALNQLFSLGLEKIDMIKVSQRAEHNYAGVLCGIMDQYASVMGKKDHALMLDCKLLEHHYFHLDLKDHLFILFNSNVSHNLAGSEYNVRRKQCEDGVAVIGQRYESVKSLRDVTMPMLEEVRPGLSEVVFNRCKYILEENERVHALAQALNDGDMASAGNILQEAQQGMADAYEITCPEIDYMADFANNHSGVAGSRMMGGGFGGCTINLVRKDAVEEVTALLSDAYTRKFKLKITPINITIADGVQAIDP